MRVGLVFDVGGRGDKSFNDAAYAGLLRAQKELGRDAWSSSSRPAARTARRRCASSRRAGSTSSSASASSSRATSTASRGDFPAVRFACVDYAPPPGGAPPNVAGLAFREEEGSYLVGGVAGLVSKTRHVGFVGGMRGPLIRKFEAGYEAGVKAVCPACVVHAAYVGTSPDAFKDPAKGKALAIAEIAAGADVLYHASGATGHGVFEAAHDARALRHRRRLRPVRRDARHGRHEHGQARRRGRVRHHPRGERGALRARGCTSSA